MPGTLTNRNTYEDVVRCTTALCFPHFPVSGACKADCQEQSCALLSGAAQHARQTNHTATRGDNQLAQRNTRKNATSMRNARNLICRSNACAFNVAETRDDVKPVKLPMRIISWFMTDPHLYKHKHELNVNHEEKNRLHCAILLPELLRRNVSK